MKALRPQLVPFPEEDLGSRPVEVDHHTANSAATAGRGLLGEEARWGLPVQISSTGGRDLRGPNEVVPGELLRGAALICHLTAPGPERQKPRLPAHHLRREGWATVIGTPFLDWVSVQWVGPCPPHHE